MVAKLQYLAADKSFLKHRQAFVYKSTHAMKIKGMKESQHAVYMQALIVWLKTKIYYGLNAHFYGP